MHTVKPIDKQAVIDAARQTERIITVEDHNIINGLGSAVCEVVAEEGGAIVRRVGIPDAFGESGKYHDLLESRGICASNIFKIATEMVGTK